MTGPEGVMLGVSVTLAMVVLIYNLIQWDNRTQNYRNAICDRLAKLEQWRKDMENDGK